MQDLISDYIFLEDFFMTANIKRALEQHQGEMASQQVLQQLFLMNLRK